MAKKADEQNRRAENVNPLRSGVRTGNPQLQSRKHGAKGKGPAKHGRQATRKVKSSR